MKGKLLSRKRVSRARTVASELSKVDIDFSDTESDFVSDETNIVASSSTLNNNQSSKTSKQNRIGFPDVARACDKWEFLIEQQQ